MTFAEKIKKTMKELNINQTQLSGMTGIRKNSLSQYMSGLHIPPVDKQRAIARALMLDEDYFLDKRDATPRDHYNGPIVPRMKPEEAAKAWGAAASTIQKGLQQRVFPWGYAVETSPGRWTYLINAKRFAEIEGIEILGEGV